MNYKEAMEYMNSVSQYGSVLGLENTKELLKRLGNPQDKLRFVHVAGTNGKGSVCAYITSILSNSGYRVGRYVSPTIFEYREKVQIIDRKSGQSEMEHQADRTADYISEENVAKHLTKIKEVIEGMAEDGLPHPTPFEIETAMAFLEFLDAKCQLVVLETGMGGRLDSTNVIATTDCAVLTSISMDHMGFLGHTLREIAGEKAGIIKPGIKVVSYDQKAEAKQIIEAKAAKEKAELVFVDFSNINKVAYSLSGTVFAYGSERIKTLFPQENMSDKTNELIVKTPLLGENQPKNAAAAIEAVLSLKELGYQITKENIINGIGNAKWQGRLEIVNEKPLVFVDGAHNYEAALSLKKSMEIYFQDKKIFAVVGMFADKEYDKVLSVTLDNVEEVFTIKPNNPRGLASEILAECASKYCDKVINAGEAANALKLASQAAGKEDIILCFGSLSFLHEIYEYFE